MRPVVLWAALAVWLAGTALALWTLNPVAATDLADVCATARTALSRPSLNRR